MTPRHTAHHCRLLILLRVFIAVPASSGVYKWTDENGQVHYGERPANADAEKIDIIQPPFPKQVSVPEKDVSKDEETQPKQGQQPSEGVTEEWVEAPLTGAQKRLLCRESRDRLANIESRGRLRASDGTRRILSPQERQQLINGVRKDIRAYCR